MAFVTVNGKKAFYTCPRDVAGGETRGKVVLLIHGARSNHKIWAPQIRALAWSHTPIGMDLPGHGESQGTGSTDVSEYREFVKGLVDALGLQKFVMAGHSMGGSIALDYALHYPGVEALIPVGSAAKWAIDQEYIAALRADPEEALKKYGRRNFAKSTPGAIIELNNWNNKTIEPSVGVGDLEACNGFDVLANLGKIDVPTCIVCGEEDQYAEGSRILNDRIAGSQVHWVKDAGHDPSIEQPLATNRIFLEFLGSLS